MGKKTKGRVSFFIFILFLALLVYTNPTEDDFKEYIKDEITEEADPFWVGILDSLLDATIEPLIERDDYVFISIYEFENLDGTTTKYLGAFNNFIQIQQEE